MAGCKDHGDGKPKKGCTDLLSGMSDYVDGEMEPERSNKLEEHLKNCPPCLMVLKTLKKTLGIFRRKKDTGEIPKECSDALHDAVHKEMERKQG